MTDRIKAYEEGEGDWIRRRTPEHMQWAYRQAWDEWRRKKGWPSSSCPFHEVVTIWPPVD